VLDGMLLSDPTTSNALVNINFDVIEEVEFELGGLPAEVGQADAAYINIISKGGGNRFTGGLSAYLTGNGLTKDLIPKSETDAYQVDPPGNSPLTATSRFISEDPFSRQGLVLPERPLEQLEPDDLRHSGSANGRIGILWNRLRPLRL